MDSFQNVKKNTSKTRCLRCHLISRNSVAGGSPKSIRASIGDILWAPLLILKTHPYRNPIPAWMCHYKYVSMNWIQLVTAGLCPFNQHATVPRGTKSMALLPKICSSSTLRAIRSKLRKSETWRVGGQNPCTKHKTFQTSGSLQPESKSLFWDGTYNMHTITWINTCGWMMYYMEKDICMDVHLMYV